jgi:hypothetical protein
MSLACLFFQDFSRNINEIPGLSRPGKLENGIPG